jgi:hypothetical protein
MTQYRQKVEFDEIRWVAINLLRRSPQQRSGSGTQMIYIGISREFEPWYDQFISRSHFWVAFVSCQ